MWDPLELAQRVGTATYERGLAYAQAGRTTVEAHEPLLDNNLWVIEARTQGSSAKSYSQSVVYSLKEQDGSEVLDQWSGTCDCPVGSDCKHCVSATLTALDLVAEEEPLFDTQNIDSSLGYSTGEDWLRQWNQIFAQGNRPATEQVAIGIQLVPPEQQFYFANYARANFGGYWNGPQRYAHVDIRALKLSKANNWIKTGASFSAIAGQRLSVDPSIASLFEELLINLQTGRYYYSDKEEFNVSDTDNPRIGRILKEIIGLSVPLIDIDTKQPVIVCERPVVPRMKITEKHDGTTLEAVLQHPDMGVQDAKNVAPIGSGALGAMWKNRSRLYLAWSEAEAPEQWKRLRRKGGLDIPAHARSRFKELMDSQMMTADHLGLDGSSLVVVKEPDPPVPQLTMTITPQGEWLSRNLPMVATVVWNWNYVEATSQRKRNGSAQLPGTRPVVFGPLQLYVSSYSYEAVEGVSRRNHSAETRILTKVLKILRKSGTEQLLYGNRISEYTALRGVNEILQVKALIADLQKAGVDVHDETPDLQVTDDLDFFLDIEGSNRDWLDLNVTLRVNGQDVPVSEIIPALTLGQEHLYLGNGVVIDLTNPELQKLADLLAEARGLTDARSKTLRVPRVRLSWWQDLLELGIVQAAENAWFHHVRQAFSKKPQAAPLPQGLQATLRHYQVTGFEWLTILRGLGLGGVLADDMGLGKTVQVLAMILSDRQNAPESGPWVVAAPTSVVSNWVSEARKFTPDLNVVAVTATAKRREVSLSELAEGADLVVTSYTLMRLEAEDYRDLKPTGLILDEAQNVKNPHSQVFAAAMRMGADGVFAVTGTPIENNLSELWAVFALTAPGLLGTMHQFNQTYRRPIERAIRKQQQDASASSLAAGRGRTYTLPAENVRVKGQTTETGSTGLPAGTLSGNATENTTPVDIGNPDANQALATLKRRIAPFILARKKTQVALDLPPKQEQVLYVPLERAHRRLYDRQLQRERQKILGLLDDADEHRIEILAALTRLRQMAIDAKLLDATAEAPSSKLNVLMELLDEIVQEGHRVLVFSQFTRFLRMIRDRMDLAHMEYVYLDGTTRNRDQVIQSFATGTVPVFLISLKAGGVGLNLTMADYAILTDPWWNPAAEDQAVDRTHRIGQTRPVHVYRLVSSDTIEQKVVELQAEKRALIDAVVASSTEGSTGSSSSTGFAGKLTGSQLKALFE